MGSVSSLRKGISVQGGNLKRLFALALFICPLAGCASGSLLAKAEKDASIVTSSVPEPTPAAKDSASDEQTIRNAVSSANLEELGGKPLPWANLSTGSRGSVSSITEYKERGTLCRKYKASVESFQGIHMVAGDTCLGGDGQWWTRQFVRI